MKRIEKLPRAAEISWWHRCGVSQRSHYRVCAPRRTSRAHDVGDTATAGVHHEVEYLLLDRAHRHRVRRAIIVVLVSRCLAERTLSNLDINLGILATTTTTTIDLELVLPAESERLSPTLDAARLFLRDRDLFEDALFGHRGHDRVQTTKTLTLSGMKSLSSRLGLSAKARMFDWGEALTMAVCKSKCGIHQSFLLLSALTTRFRMTSWFVVR